MFCKKCGNQLNDGALFCNKCGSKIEYPQAAESAPLNSIPVTSQLQNQEYSTSQNSFQNTVQGSYQNASQAQYDSNSGSYVQPEYTNITPKKKSGVMGVLAIIFSVLALAASVLSSVSTFIDGEIGSGFEYAGFAIGSIGLFVYSISAKKSTSIIKAIVNIIVTALHVAFYGISGYESAFVILSNAKSGIDYYYAIILLIGLTFLYIYLWADTIRCFTNKAGGAVFIQLIAYLAVLLSIAVFVIDVVSGIKGLFVFSFIPVDLGIFLFIFGNIFAISGRNKKLG